MVNYIWTHDSNRLVLCKHENMDSKPKQIISICGPWHPTSGIRHIVHDSNRVGPLQTWQVPSLTKSISFHGPCTQQVALVPIVPWVLAMDACVASKFCWYWVRTQGGKHVWLGPICVRVVDKRLYLYAMQCTIKLLCQLVNRQSMFGWDNRVPDIDSHCLSQTPCYIRKKKNISNTFRTPYLYY